MTDVEIFKKLFEDEPHEYTSGSLVLYEREGVIVELLESDGVQALITIDRGVNIPEKIQNIIDTYSLKPLPVGDPDAEIYMFSLSV